MKKNHLFFIPFVILSITIIVFACNKMETPPVQEDENIAIASDDIENIQASIVILDEILQDIEKDLFFKSAGDPVCPARTVNKPQDGTYPRTITQDFGGSCADRFGIIRSGKIITILTGPWLRKGTERKVKFENFYCRKTFADIFLSISSSKLIVLLWGDAGVVKRVWLRTR